MANIYTKDDPELSDNIYFLNGNNITHDINIDGKTNPIPSIRVVKDISDYISGIGVGNKIGSGQILTSLSQSGGFIDYGTTELLSSHVKYLPEYVTKRISDINTTIQNNGHQIISSLEQKDGKVEIRFKPILSAYVNGLPELGEKISQIGSDISGFVKKSGDQMWRLSVINHLDSSIPQWTKVKIDEDGVSLDLKGGDKLIDISSDNGLEDIRINGTTVKQTLMQLSDVSYTESKEYVDNKVSSMSCEQFNFYHTDYSHTIEDYHIISSLDQENGKIKIGHTILKPEYIYGLSDFIGQRIVKLSDFLSIDVKLSDESPEGYISTYYITQGGERRGIEINIPKTMYSGGETETISVSISDYTISADILSNSIQKRHLNDSLSAIFYKDERNTVLSDTVFYETLCVDYKNLKDTKAYKISDVVEIDNTFGSMYNGIANIITECKLSNIDFDLSYPIVSAFNSINLIAKDDKINVPQVSVDLNTSTVNDGFEAIKSIGISSTYEIHRDLNGELQKIDNRFDLNERSIGTHTVQISALEHRITELEEKISAMETFLEKYTIIVK